MKHNHENKMLFCTAIFSTFVSICILALGISYGNRLQKEKEDQVPTVHIESPESKLMMVAMHCQKMEQDNDILLLRIEELEDMITAITNVDHSVCGQYWLYRSETNDLSKSQEIKIDASLAVDDLVPTNSI